MSNSLLEGKRQTVFIRSTIGVSADVTVQFQTVLNLWKERLGGQRYMRRDDFRGDRRL